MRLQKQAQRKQAAPKTRPMTPRHDNCACDMVRIKPLPSSRSPWAGVAYRTTSHSAVHKKRTTELESGDTMLSRRAKVMWTKDRGYSVRSECHSHERHLSRMMNKSSAIHSPKSPERRPYGPSRYQPGAPHARRDLSTLHDINNNCKQLISRPFISQGVTCSDSKSFDTPSFEVVSPIGACWNKTARPQCSTVATNIHL
jgi:hypothetical protein